MKSKVSSLLQCAKCNFTFAHTFACAVTSMPPHLPLSLNKCMSPHAQRPALSALCVFPLPSPTTHRDCTVASGQPHCRAAPPVPSTGRRLCQDLLEVVDYREQVGGDRLGSSTEWGAGWKAHWGRRHRAHLPMLAPRAPTCLPALWVHPEIQISALSDPSPCVSQLLCAVTAVCQNRRIQVLGPQLVTNALTELAAQDQGHGPMQTTGMHAHALSTAAASQALLTSVHGQLLSPPPPPAPPGLEEGELSMKVGSRVWYGC